MARKIAILGAGATGHAIAADLTLAGLEACLFEQSRFKEVLEPVSRQGGITLKGAARNGFAKIKKVTTEIGEALKDASIIFVAVVATRHEEVAELCAPYLQNGQTVVITPGNAGSLIFARKLAEKKAEKQVHLAEVEGNLHPCRLVGPGEVLVALPPKPKYMAAFPAKHTKKAIQELKDIYEVVPATNVLETSLNAPNVVIHLAGSLLNCGAIEQTGGQYFLYQQGLTPAVLKCIEAICEEKSALFKALGYVDRSPLEFLKRVSNREEFPELATFRGLIGPTSLRHRYITEDAPMGVSLLVSLGEMLGIPTPVARGLLALASAIHHVDYFALGRTLQKLGLIGLTVAELNTYLEKGK